MVVKKEDSRPVRRRCIRGSAVGGGDACLDVIDAEGESLSGEVEAGDAALDHRMVPVGAILLMQAQEIARIIGASGQAGGVEQHQGEQRKGARLSRGGMLCEQGDEVGWLRDRDPRAQGDHR